MRHKPTDVILRARNGDVIAYDDTGLILRLSDQVIRDIAGRLGPGGGADAVPQDAAVLGDVDAWNVRRQGDWYLFDACLPEFDHTRAFRRPVAGGDIVADAPGPVQAILALGGPRVSDGYDLLPRYPSHVVAPADELGAAGACGTVDVTEAPGFQRLFEATQGSFLADAVLARRQSVGRALPLIVTRAESDSSHTIDTFSKGTAWQNLTRLVEGVVAGAEGIGQSAQVMACVIDFAEEDVISAPEPYETALRGLIDAVNDLCHRHAMAEPVILLRCEGAARLDVQWAMAVHPAGNRVCVPGPRYACGQDRFRRLTVEGAKQQAALDAAAIEAVQAGVGWTCPVPLLAEFADASGVIAVTCQSAGLLVIDPDDPFGSGAGAGFRLTTQGAEVPIISVSIAANDPRMILIRFDPGSADGALMLSYADGCAGALRDDWAEAAECAAPLHRWALPARLQVR